MGQVRLHVGGRGYDLACRDGEEGKLQALAAAIDAKAAQAMRAVGSGSEVRVLLLAALLLADELAERAEPSEGERVQPLLESLADRLEKLAGRLEPGARDA